MEYDKMDTFGCVDDLLFTRKFMRALHPTDDCSRIVIKGSEIDFYTQEIAAYPGDKNWTLRAKSVEGTYNATKDSLVRIFLPEEQKVFQNQVDAKRRYHFDAEWVMTFAKQKGILKNLGSGEKTPYIFYFKPDPLTSRNFFTQVDTMQLENILCLDLCFNFGRD